MALLLASVALVLSTASICITLTIAYRLSNFSATIPNQLDLDDMARAAPSIRIGTRLPTLTLSDTRSSRALELSGLLDRSIIIFVTAQCRSCRELISELDERLTRSGFAPLADRFCSRIVVLNIGSGTSRNLVSRVTINAGILWKLNRSQREPIRTLFEVRATPAYCLIERTRIISCGLAGGDLEEWDEAIESVIEDLI